MKFVLQVVLGIWLGQLVNLIGQPQAIDLTWHPGDTDPVRIEPAIVKSMGASGVAGTVAAFTTTSGTSNTITVVGAGGGPASNSLYTSK